jgi:arsenite/tail-anchored protein-transporting ATPase
MPPRRHRALVNNSLAAGAPKSALLRQRSLSELNEIDQVTARHSSRHAVVPLGAVEPVGVDRLLQLSAPVNGN